MSDSNATANSTDLSMERTVVGVSYILTSTAMIIPYIVCMYVMNREKKFRGVAFYRLAFFMGVTDISQLTFNGLYGGLCCLLPFEMPYVVQKVDSSLLCMCWFTYTALAHVLAVDRFVTVFFPDKVEEVFSPRNTSIMIAVCFLHGAMWFGIYAWPDVYSSFSIEEYGFVFDFDKSMSMLALQIVSYEDYVHAGCMIIWYTLIYLKLKWKKNEVLDMAIVHDRKKEKKVLLQSVVLCSMDIATIAGYLLIQLVPHTRWATMITNYIWLFCAGNCPLIYLTLNRGTLQQPIEMQDWAALLPILHFDWLLEYGSASGLPLEHSQSSLSGNVLPEENHPEEQYECMDETYLAIVFL